MGKTATSKHFQVNNMMSTNFYGYNSKIFYNTSLIYLYGSRAAALYYGDEEQRLTCRAIVRQGAPLTFSPKSFRRQIPALTGGTYTLHSTFWRTAQWITWGMRSNTDFPPEDSTQHSNIKGLKIFPTLSSTQSNI